MLKHFPVNPFGFNLPDETEIARIKSAKKVGFRIINPVSLNIIPG